MNLLKNIVEFIQNSGVLGVFISCGLIGVESILPILPLSVFITIVMLVLGNFWGFIVSWIFTMIGCIMSYFIFKNGLGKKFDHLTEDKELIKKYKKVFKNISLGKLILIVSMPFTPAFVVNIVAGLSKMDFKKFFLAILIGKPSMIYFWGYIGTSLIESIQNPLIIIKIVICMVLSYLVYLVLSKILKIE